MEDVGVLYRHSPYSTAILVYFMAIWCIFSRFGKFLSSFVMLYQEKSGNPALKLVLLLRIVPGSSLEGFQL
jgi:hypothetical protein